MKKDNVFDASDIKWPKLPQSPFTPVWGNICNGRTGELIARIDFTDKNFCEKEGVYKVACIWNSDGTLTLKEN